MGKDSFQKISQVHSSDIVLLQICKKCITYFA